MTFIPKLLALAAFILLPSHGYGSSDEDAVNAWATVPDILKRIVPPVFPKKDFPITAHGAVEGGKTECAKAFAEAIKACADAGGGRVVVPPGKFLTGPVHLRSNVELHLSEGTEVIFSDRFEDYLPVVPVRVGGVEVMNDPPLIYANECVNVAVTGKGETQRQRGKMVAMEGQGNDRALQNGCPQRAA